MKKDVSPTLTFSQATFLVLLRIAIGWHFLFEGVRKLADPLWSSRSYLEAAHGPFAGFFQWILANPAMLEFADRCTIYGLVFAGLSLMLGAFTTLGCTVAAVLLVLFYVSNPPWGGMYAFGAKAPGTEGTYLVVNKNLIELFAVLALAFLPTGRWVGFDAVLVPLWQRCGVKRACTCGSEAQEQPEPVFSGRRTDSRKETCLP